MAWRAWLVVLLAAAAGCSSPPQPPIETSPPEPTAVSSFPVPPGEWIRFRPAADGGAFAFDGHLEFAYEMYEVRGSDAFECETAASPDGWLPWGPTQRVPDFHAGLRQDGQETWRGVQHIDHSGDVGFSLLGAQAGPDAAFLVAADVFGPGVTASVSVQDADPPLEVLASGRFWCLHGVSRYPVGEFAVTPTVATATGLAWSMEMEQGVLVRVVGAATAIEARLTTPQGATHRLPDDAGAFDYTFCADGPGAWTLAVDRLEALPGMPWSLTALVLDTDHPVLPCGAQWSGSPVAEAVIPT